MATQFLRKIILEELQKVLKEDQAAFTQTGRDVVGLGSGTKVGGYADKLTAAQKAEAQKLVDASQGRLTFEQAAQQVAAKAMGTGAIASGQGLSGLERIARATIKPSKNQIIDLQRQLVKFGLLRSDEVDGIYGPKTQEATSIYVSSIDPSQKFSRKSVSKFSADDVSAITSDIKTMNPQQIAQARKDAVTSQVSKYTREIDSKLSKDTAVPPAEPTGGKKELEPEPVGPTAAQKAALEAQAKKEREERAKAQKALQPQIPKESLTREINKLLKML